MSAALTYDVHVAPSIPTAIADRPPGLDQRIWSPISSTLISGERDAVLVDVPLTLAQTHTLTDWVVASGKNLTTVYVTHGHGDHWFGLATLLERFPEARAVAVAGVVEQMHRQVVPEFMEKFWNTRFPGQIPRRIVAAEVLDGDTIELEGQQLVPVELGHTDTDDTTCLHVPSIGLVVAGDAAYNDVHLYLAESPPAQRTAWGAALGTIAALAPRAVVAGHKRDGRADDPTILEETRRYLDDFEAACDATSSTLELYQAMLALHPTRLNNGALWGSARSAKG
jgi:glyoxylase-like metal-dependent hydrolase (beta-lactamase superfamily II)